MNVQNRQMQINRIFYLYRVCFCFVFILFLFLSSPEEKKRKERKPKKDNKEKRIFSSFIHFFSYFFFFLKESFNELQNIVSPIGNFKTLRQILFSPINQPVVPYLGSDQSKKNKE